MTLRDVIDVHDVEAGIDVGGQAARRRVRDHAARWRRLHVARADRSGGIDDHRRQPGLAHQREHCLLRPVLGLFIDAHHNVLAHRRGLVSGRAILVHAERRNAAAIDDALHACGLRSEHQGARAFDIGAQHRRGIGHPDAVIGGDVEQVRQPFTARASVTGSARSPSTSLATSPVRLRLSLVGRTSTRTECPRATSVRATAEPTNPVAPVTNVRGCAMPRV